MMDTLHKQLFYLWQLILHKALMVLPQLALGLVLMLLAIIAANIAKKTMTTLAAHRHRQPLYQLIARMVRVAILFAGLITALGTIGINIMALITGLGLAGFAVGFALKDTLSNCFSGFIILLYEPVTVGDTVEVNKITGDIVAITLRYTIISTDNETTYLPNAMLLNSPLTKKSKPNH